MHPFNLEICMLKSLSKLKPEHQCKLLKLKSRSGKIPRVAVRAGMIAKTRPKFQQLLLANVKIGLRSLTQKSALKF